MTKRPEAAKITLIQPEEFPAEFRRIVGGDVAGTAEQLGISSAFVYMLMQGTRKPSAALLAKCGFKVVFLRESA